MRLLPKLRWVQGEIKEVENRGTIPRSAYVGAYLVKIDQEISTMGKLRRFLLDHPALIWALGFPLEGEKRLSGRFDPEASVPSQRYLSQRLSTMPNEILQQLLAGSVHRIGSLLPAEVNFGRTVSLDTKHILAWVKENNPKQFIKEGRYDKTKQPKGDRDCKLGCKRRRNVTPTTEGKPAEGKKTIGEFYWGYASGVVATKVEGWESLCWLR